MNKKIEETYYNQFKPMIEHRDAILILDSEMDREFVEKRIACIEANQYLEQLLNKKFKFFDDNDFPIY